MFPCIQNPISQNAIFLSTLQAFPTALAMPSSGAGGRMCSAAGAASGHISGLPEDGPPPLEIHAWKLVAAAADEVLAGEHQPLQLDGPRVVACTTVRHGHGMPWVVTHVSLPGAGIHGKLGDLNFSALPFLTHLDLGNNGLHGTIATSNITSLLALSYLNLSNWLCLIIILLKPLFCERGFFSSVKT
jgi:hypothetical protein